MKYLSIDIETTGVNPETDVILEFAAVLEDTTLREPIENLPVFHCYVCSDSGKYNVSPFIMKMHKRIFEKFEEIGLWTGGLKCCRNQQGDLFTTEDYLLELFSAWLRDQGIKDSITVAGKNFASFDKLFLDKLVGETIRMKRRVLDPAILYYRPGDSELPDSKECCRRAGINCDNLHSAVDDAKMVIQLLRNKGI